MADTEVEVAREVIILDVEEIEDAVEVVDEGGVGGGEALELRIEWWHGMNSDYNQA